MDTAASRESRTLEPKVKGTEIFQPTEESGWSLLITSRKE